MTNAPNVCEKICNQAKSEERTRLVVITGGPGAGKTALLEMAKNVFCEHVAILPESASIVFGGGFWRLPSTSAKMAAQSAIYHTQVEMENLVVGEKKWAVGLCDRGTLDGLAYWPKDESAFWEMSRSQASLEYQKYSAVIHLHSPTDLLGYNQQNPLRIENAIQANEIDEKIARAWAGHPNYEVIDSAADFLTKTQAAMRLFSKYIPECCQASLKESINAKI